MYGLALLASSPVWVVRLIRTGKWRTDWRGRLGYGEPVPGDATTPTVLLHGVSLGEVNATRTLVAALGGGKPPVRVVVSATTNTGFDRAQRLYGEAHTVVRFPFDFSGAVGRLLDRVRPTVVALVELEAWPNLIDACRARGIPVCVVNGRLSERSFRRYRLFRPLVRGSFAKLAAVGAQTEEYASRFAALGTAPQAILVTDTIKWDTAPLDEQPPGAAELARALGIDRERPLVVAGSTGPGEERLLLRGRPPGVQLLVAPRKPERFDKVAALSEAWVRRSDPLPDPRERDLFLLDTLGELRSAYALADAVVVGRSFNGQGGSDPIEPVALGKATVIGPDHANFADVVAALAGEGGIEVARDPWPVLTALLEDRERASSLGSRGRAVIRARRGATERSATIVRELLPA